MPAILTALKLMKTPRKLAQPLAERGLLSWMSDEAYLKLVYKAEFGTQLNLINPETFNEKIQWLKLHDRNPEYVKWVDKITAKQMAAEHIGPEHVVPLLSVWDSAADINFEELPDKCVLKCNHDQGSVVIFNRNESPDTAAIKRHFGNRMKRNPFPATREWPYSQIKPKVFCEAYMGHDLIDYKLFCFNGEPAFVNIGQKSHRDHVTHVTFVDFNWKKLPFQRSDFAPVETLPEKPKQLDEMVSIARKLSKGTRFVRIDFFLVDNMLYFSEFTLYPTSGLIKFDPAWGDKELGEMLKL